MTQVTARSFLTTIGCKDHPGLDECSLFVYFNDGKGIWGRPNESPHIADSVRVPAAPETAEFPHLNPGERQLSLYYRRAVFIHGIRIPESHPPAGLLSTIVPDHLHDVQRQELVVAVDTFFRNTEADHHNRRLSVLDDFDFSLIDDKEDQEAIRKAREVMHKYRK